MDMKTQFDDICSILNDDAKTSWRPGFVAKTHHIAMPPCAPETSKKND